MSRPEYLVDVARFIRSKLIVDATLLTATSGIDRIVAVAQAVFVARILGAHDFGIYGFLVTTVGFIASLVGLQLGLTGTVFVARYRRTRPFEAGATVYLAERTAWAMCITFVIVVGLGFDEIESHLFAHETGHGWAIAMGALLVITSVISGVQEGVVQGFEDFRSTVNARLVAMFVTLLAVFPLTLQFGVEGAMGAVLIGAVSKYFVLERVKLKHLVREGIVVAQGGVRIGDLLFGFALPSMLISLLVGVVTWTGAYLVTRNVEGFVGAAFVAIAMQWRTPIILAGSALGAVLVPGVSGGVGASTGQMPVDTHGKALALMAVASGLVAISIVGCSAWIAGWYGVDAAMLEATFTIVVLAAVPTALANVALGRMVGEGRQWTVLALHVPYAVVTLWATMSLVPAAGPVGYALAQALGAALLLGAALGWIAMPGRRPDTK